MAGICTHPGYFLLKVDMIYCEKASGLPAGAISNFSVSRLSFSLLYVRRNPGVPGTDSLRKVIVFLFSENETL